MRRAFTSAFPCHPGPCPAVSAEAKSRTRANPDQLDDRAAMVTDFARRVLYEQDADQRIPAPPSPRS
jgi:D-alanyl-D-alanine carboxypeptidase